MSQGHQNLNISSHVPIVFLCKCGQNPLIVSGDKVQTRLIFYRFYSVVTLKIMSSPKSNQIFKPSQCYMKVGLDPLFCSRDRVQTSFFCVLSEKNWKFQSAGVTLKMRPRSPKSNHFFPPSQLVGWLCWGLTSQSTIFQSCRDGAIASWVVNHYFRGVKCLAQGHNTAAVGLEPRTSRSGVRHSTTEPPRSPPHPSNLSGQNPPIDSGDRVQTRSNTDIDGIRTKHNMPPPPLLFGWGDIIR